MQSNLECDVPALYKNITGRDLTNSMDLVRLPDGTRTRYGEICARAVLWFEHVSVMSRNPHLDQVISMRVNTHAVIIFLHLPGHILSHGTSAFVVTFNVHPNTWPRVC